MDDVELVIVEEGQLKGEFNGFKDENTVFRFQNGGTWRQAAEHYHYDFVDTPDAKVMRDQAGRCLLYVEGMPEPVEVRAVLAN
jgi:hypothetical protein